LNGEWNWGRGPEFDPVARAILTKPLQGGYVQAMYKVDHSPVGPFMPYSIACTPTRSSSKLLPRAVEEPKVASGRKRLR
jgi:hypothetical protein